jgi:hypothetical protein
MKHWEKNKKDLRRADDERDFRQQQHDHKKKKLKPIEKIKYKMRGYEDNDN